MKGHGANVGQISREYNIDSKDILDFSSNINPNMIDGLKEYILEGLDECRSYPDIDYFSLRNNISKYLDVDMDFIIPGNGATEIIYLLMKCIKKRLAIFNPTFSEYERSARLNNLDVVSLMLDEKNNFCIDINYVKKRIKDFDSLFVCNPNNPNGKVQDLVELLDLMEKNNKLLIVDETFIEFVEDEKKYSLVKYVKEYDNLFIVKAVTKFFGMPGLRLGYGLSSNKDIIENMYYYKEPWTINSFADNLSNYIFEDKKYISESKNYYKKESAYMLGELRKIKNIVAYDTDANFVLIKLLDKKSNDIKIELLKKGNILVRDASNFVGLDNSYIRVAIKSHSENEFFLSCLNNVLGD